MNMSNDMSLYSINKEAWDKVADAGGECLREMAKHFEMCADMDRALGFKNAASNWHAGRSGFSLDANRRARAWLQAKDAEAEQQVKETGDLLLVACRPGMAEKAKRVLAVIGCDVTEI